MDYKKFNALFIQLISLIFITCTVQQSGVLITRQDSGKKIGLHTDQQFKVELKGNPTTGYQWTIARMDSSIIQQVGSRKVQPVGKQAGALAMITFEFQAQQPGDFELVLHYKRSWEKNVAPIDTFKVIGKVK